jgi:hypothetical protein
VQCTHRFFEDPHGDLGLKHVRVSEHILSSDACDRGTPGDVSQQKSSQRNASVDVVLCSRDDDDDNLLLVMKNNEQ